MIFDSGILSGHGKGHLSVWISKLWSTCKLIYLIAMCHWEGHFRSDSFYKCWKQILKIRGLIRRHLSLNLFAWIEVPFTLIKCVTFSCFVLFKFRLEFCNANDCNIRYMIFESSYTTWKLIRWENFVLHERLHYKNLTYNKPIATYNAAFT